MQFFDFGKLRFGEVKIRAQPFHRVLLGKCRLDGSVAARPEGGEPDHDSEDGEEPDGGEKMLHGAWWGNFARTRGSRSTR